MGFFKKLFKGVKKVFKKIGKGIKSAFKKIGKFMGQIGIVGQLALGFILPGIGQALMKGAGGMFKGLTGALAKGGKIAQTAGKVLEAGAKFAKAGTSAFRTVTDGITSFVGEFTKTALKKIPGMSDMFPKTLGNASDNFLMGENSAWKTVQGGIEKNITEIGKAFGEGLDTLGSVKKIYTADAANLGQQALARTGKGTIPGSIGSTGQESLLADPKSQFNIPEKDPFAFDGEMGKKYQAALDSGTTNLTASRGNVIPDAKGVVADFDLKGAGLQNIDVATSKAGTFFGDATDFVKGRYKEFLEGRTLGQAVVQEGFDKGVETVTETIGGDIKTRLSQEAGIVKTPEAPVSYGTYVAPYQQVGIQDYGSPQINDRAMQMTINPEAFLQQNPYGYGANIYQQQMNIKYGGVA